MRTAASSDRSERAALLGLLLIAAGVAAMLLRQFDIDLVRAIGNAGWPLFVILPGLALLGAAVLAAPPAGRGFAIAGSIVTAVGALLWYQERANHFESWAYAWALLPGAAGLGLLAYGALYRLRADVAEGARLVAVSAVMFAVGLWFFETIFDTGRAPIDLGDSWPVLLIALGIVVLAAGVVTRRSQRTQSLAQVQQGDEQWPPQTLT